MSLGGGEEQSCAAQIEEAWLRRESALASMLSPSIDDWVCEREAGEAIWELTNTVLDISLEKATTDTVADEPAKVIAEWEDDLNEASSEAFHDYALCFDYVWPGTFDDQPNGYWRYQLSYGGPSEEIRFFGIKSDPKAIRAEFWYLDWFDGARRDVTHTKVAEWLWDRFSEYELLHHAYEEARP